MDIFNCCNTSIFPFASYGYDAGLFMPQSVGCGGYLGMQNNLFSFPTMGNFDSFMGMPMMGGFMPFGGGSFNIYGSGGSKGVSGSGANVPDGTSITVSGIDYSIFGKSASEIKKLRPTMQLKVFQMWKYAKNKGWKITLVAGFRSYAQQKHLWDLKQKGIKKCAVARPGTSWHEFGCAVDIKINGKSGGKELKELAEYAKSIGVGWGGNRFSEPWHFDMDPAKTPKGKQNSNSVA